MGVKMAECEPPPVSDYFSKSDYSRLATPKDPYEPPFLPYWARYESQCAQNLLDYSDEPIEYDHDDEDYSDNCFFFPEDCSYTPPKAWLETHCISLEDTYEIEEEYIRTGQDAKPDTTTDIDTDTDTDTMIPGLPDIKMLDSEALSDLLEDNLSPPEITTIMCDPPLLTPSLNPDLNPKPQTYQLTNPPASSQQTVQSSPMAQPSPPANSET
jgi:hypothetical protein